jgi:hypothetical protein
MPPKNEISKVEKINLTATIVGPVVLLVFMAWCVWSFNARFTIEMQTEDKKNADAYVSKVWFEKSHDDINKQLSDISGSVNTLTTTVAEMKGELSVKQSPAVK